MTTPGDQALIDSWALSLHALRPRTVTIYVKNLRLLCSWLEERGVELHEVTKQYAQAWVKDMQDRGLKGNTVRSRFYAARSFYKWAADEGEVAVNPVGDMAVRRPSEPPPDVLTEAEEAALLRACQGTTFRDRRDMAIIRLGLATGLRAAELCGLELADVDLQNRLAVVRDGKGGRQRVVRFDPATAAAIDRYRRVRARRTKAHLPALWLGQRGALAPDSGLGHLLAVRAREAGIRHVHPHMLRHSFADRWLSNGGTEGDLQQLGGWESAQVMRRYGAAQAVDRALRAYDRVDPMGGV